MDFFGMCHAKRCFELNKLWVNQEMLIRRNFGLIIYNKLLSIKTEWSFIKNHYLKIKLIGK